MHRVARRCIDGMIHEFSCPLHSTKADARSSFLSQIRCIRPQELIAFLLLNTSFAPITKGRKQHYVPCTLLESQISFLVSSQRVR